jgi:hypothetical protein
MNFRDTGVERSRRAEAGAVASLGAFRPGRLIRRRASALLRRDWTGPAFRYKHHLPMDGHPFALTKRSGVVRFPTSALAFILVPLLAALAGCGGHAQTSTQAQPPDSGGLAGCERFARPASAPLGGGMSFTDAGRHIVLRPGERCRTSQGYFMGVDR